MATIKAKNDWDFSDEELSSLRDLVSALEPLELAIRKLGSKGNIFRVKYCLHESTHVVERENSQ